MKLSQAARNAVRSAISNHANWNTYRKANDLVLSNMSAEQFRATAEALNIDVFAIATKANEEAATMSPKAERARSIFASDSTEEGFNQPKAETKASDGFGLARLPEPKAFDAENHYRNGGQDFRAKGEEAVKEMKSDAEFRAVMAEVEAKNHADTGTMSVRIDPLHAKAAQGADDKLAQVTKLIASLLATPTVDAEQVRSIVRQEIEDAGCASSIAKVQLLNSEGAIVNTMTGAFHPKFPLLLKVAQGRKANGQRLSVWLTGPAGSGKTTAVQQVAKALDMPFHYNGSVGMSHELFGFIDAAGCYHRTAFRDAYENGGVYLFDEVDGSDANALLTANGPLAGTVATFPDGQVQRHPDCIIFATANTWGLGANSDYVGRTKLDGAFVDRFDIKIEWTYDDNFELQIASDTAFALRVQAARRDAKANGVKVLITPRATLAGCALLAQGFTSDEAADLTYRANLNEAQRAMIP